MTRRATPKLAAYLGLAALGLLAALALNRPELVVLSSPFALLAGLALATSREPRVALELGFDRDRVLQGEEVRLGARLASPTGVERLELELLLPDGVEMLEGRNPVAVQLGRGGSRELDLRLRPERWGAFVLGKAVGTVDDRLHFLRYEAFWDKEVPLRVYPRPEYLTSLLRPLETQVSTGNQVSRQKGEGIEFADIRPFVPGDRIRRINWRASARRSELWVNETHAERNAEVVLLLDTFAEARSGNRGTLDATVRAAYAVAERYLREKDRVGLVSFGGFLNWLQPGSGLIQLYRIVDSLLESGVALSYVWRGVDLIPRRILPPKALVLGLSPLLGERAGTALLDLRSRGFDVAVVEVSPLPFVEPGDSEEERLAFRIWRLRRDAVRSRLVRAGVPVAVWEDGQPLARTLEEVTSFRRYRLQAHA